jgi:hypothetical protein
MDVIKQIDYMIACLEMVKEEINYKKRWEMKIKMREDNDWNWYKIHRTPNNALIKGNLRNVGRTGFKLAKDLEVGE